MKALYKILMLTGVLVAMAACNEDPEYFTLEDQPDEMNVTINVDTIRLSAARLNDVAIKLTWSAIESEDSVSYMVQLYASDNKNEDYTEFYDVGTATEFTLTHNELNSIVARWALAGEEISITAQVVGTIHDELKYIKPEVSTVKFTAIGWEKYPTNLYLYTSVNSAVTTLSQLQQGTGVYSASLTFSPCTYHFTTYSYSDYPAYYADDEGKLLYVDEEGDYQEFENDLPTNTYTIIVDVNDEYLDSRILYIQMDADARPSIVGDGCEIGWNTGVASSYMSLVSDPRTPYIYTWTGQFYATGEYPGDEDSEGTFKVLLYDSYGDKVFFAPEENTNPLENHLLLPARINGNDYKWLVPETGEYTFTIDVYDMTTSYEKAN